ncbi:TPR domain protein [Novosphingobium nitrogenifigens DSM 19370]|uniref:TPR domain protein n=1 Tax=Novosphingobium nitrogenifigens DSM 19370 TaxID=983920 RepID=F1Z3E9_9SPHN|nr:tetratricopeptide repeat-containing sulfotransferase family protein [Novosphingobium nitrogenifigens]EGD60864.1 TPR domain protein [Novosphingobium nitrogenifigens DSM 19370]
MQHATIEHQIQRAQAHLRGQRAEAALADAQAILQQVPDQRDALYLRAVCLRYLGRVDHALAACATLLEAAPDYGRGWQEMGHALRAAKRPEDAANAYARAIERNPALDGAWRALAQLHGNGGRHDLADDALRQLAWLERLPPELRAVEDMIAEHRLEKAEQIVRAFLRVNPTHVEAMRQLALIGMALNVLDDAETLLAKAHEFAPGDRRVHTEYVNVLLRRQKYAQALVHAERLLLGDPDNAAPRVSRANARLGVGDMEGAIADYDKVLALWPQAESVHLSRGHALKTIGRHADAVEAYRAAYGVRGDFGDAYWSLANLKTYRFTPDEQAALAHWHQAPRVNEVDRIHLHFAYAKALEDAGDHAAAFAQYEAGNALRAARSRYSPAAMDAEVARMIAATPASLFTGATGGAPDPDPIFIVGLPRAGSTLIEQILASHSAIEGTAELPNVLAQVHALSGRDTREADAHYPANLARIAPEDFTRMGERYMAETRTLRSGKPFFIDKMPNNFRHIGLIARMLPKARIIDARREPMACCFSGFKQLFAEGQDFSYNLESIGRYYRSYLTLMDHWHTVLPGRILTVRHEDVLDDLEGQVARMLDYLDLPFEEACIRFHETRRAVRTASSEQVRRPIDRTGSEQWRNFAPYLTPLRKALGDALPQ